MTIDRLFYYSSSTGRGAIGGVNADNQTFDIRAIPAGSFAKDWTEIVAE